jgi:hypothetical protein
MNLEDYPKRGWQEGLALRAEIKQLLNAIDDTVQEVAMKLGVGCGLRTHEIVRVTPEDVADTDAGTMLQMWESAKTDHYRETPHPAGVHQHCPDHRRRPD